MASPRSISTLLNMVSFSLFLSHLYMTLILFITPRQYYSPQLLQGFSAEDFTLSLISPLPWVLHSPQLFRGGLQPPDFPLFSTIFIIRSMSAEGISIKHMVKITQSCSIINSPRYNPLIPKAYYNNPVFFLSEAYPRRI